MYTTGQKFGILSSAHQGWILFDVKYSKLLEKKVQYYYNLKNCFLFEYIVIYFCDGFQHHYSRLQCHMILQKSLESASQLLVITGAQVLKMVLCTVALLIIFIFKYKSFAKL